MSLLKADIRLRLSALFRLDCQFELAAGFTVLFGSSGAGKTSVLDCIAGLRKPDAGHIAVGETTLFDSNKKVDVPTSERGIAYVFQDLALFPHLSVADNVSYGLQRQSSHMQEERSEGLLSQFGIQHLSAKRPSELSGGERQRVALARSLVTEPRALLLDEPLAALDRTTRLKLLDTLRSWNESHRVPILYVTHSVREALALGQRVLILEAGRMSADGLPGELLDREEWG